MIPVNITEKVISLRACDWDRTLFDELVPLPEGTTYNSYLIKGSEKTALVDTVYPPKTSGFVEALRAMNLGRLDYIVSNHAEQDHSGSIPAVLELFPQAKVVTNEKCMRMIMDALPVPKEAFIVVKEGETLSLGDVTLKFLVAPWVHWPDTMLTYAEEERIVFTCDFLGAHFATSDLFATDEARVKVAAKRYYAEIMMPYRSHSKKALERLSPLKLDFIAPSHGPVHSRPAFITDLYADWTSDSVKPEVVIPYLSMYESTTVMVEHLVDRLMEKGLKVHPFNVVDLDSGEFAMTLVDASTLVFASPTVLAGPHPAVAYAALLANALVPKTRYTAIVGSYGWGSNMPETFKHLMTKFKATALEPVMVRGIPREEAFADLDRLANDIALANSAEKLV